MSYIKTDIGDEMQSADQTLSKSSVDSSFQSF